MILFIFMQISSQLGLPKTWLSDLSTLRSRYRIHALQSVEDQRCKNIPESEAMIIG